MKYYINRQEEYSRGYLLLRFFLGGIYIGVPHFFLLFFLTIGQGFVNFINGWIILFTGKYAVWAWNYNVKMMRYWMRVSAAFANLTDVYPAFGLGGSHPEMDFDIAYQEKQSRGTFLLRLFFGGLMLIPHYLILFFFLLPAAGTIGSAIGWIILFTGKYPKAIFNFVVTTQRWYTRVQCWSTFLTPDYPKFDGEILEGENQATEESSVVEQPVIETI